MRNLSKLLLAGGCALAISAPVMANNFKILYAFKGGKDGTQPFSALTLDAEGNLYGTTFHGGTGKCSSLGNNVGCGTVFRIAADGTKTVLYNFRGGTDDGAWPIGGMIFGADGALYGTASHGGGGTAEECEGNGCGTVYRLTTDGQETTLHHFSSDSDGHTPRSRLTVNKKGVFFGTTEAGGSGGGGTVFKLSPKGKEEILHGFADNGHDGVLPEANVVLDRVGNVYGTTLFGGGSGEGTVFKIDTNGVETVLHSFADPDGAYLYSDLMIKNDIIYGTASEGGEYGDGTVFSLTPDGVFSLLYSFSGQSGDGAAWPFGGLIAGEKGVLYGTTGRVGSETQGTVFRLAGDGTETLLHTFSGGKDGSDPQATLAMDAFGNLYGTAYSGGSTNGCAPDGCGTVFRVTP